MPPSPVPISVNNSHEKAIKTTDINRFAGYYSQGRSYSPARIAEAVDCYHMFQLQNSRPPTIREFMQASKISKAELALKIAHSTKYGHGIHNRKKVHGRVGPLSIVDPNGEIHMELCRLCLEWRSRPLRSCRHCAAQKHGTTVSVETDSKWFPEINKRKGALASKKCSFAI